MLLTDIAFAVKLARVGELFLHREYEDALAAFTSQGSVEEACDLIAIHGTLRRASVRIHVTRNVRCS